MNAQHRTSLRGIALFSILAAGCTPPTGNDNDNAAPPQASFAAAFDASDSGFLSAVWGSSPSDVFAVGGPAGKGRAFRYDGSAWTEMNVPPSAPLVWVFGFAADDVFAVGEGGVIIHYDGTRWIGQASLTTEDLWGVWGSSPDDVWAVGGDADATGIVIRRYDGSSWIPVDPPALDREGVALFKVFGTGADHVFAVGNDGLILRFDGQAWTQVPSAGVTDDIIAVWGTSRDNLVAVGGRQGGVILRYDGTAWSGGTRDGVAGLNGVFPIDSGDFLVCGINGEAGRYDPATDTYERENPQTTRTLHAAWADGAGRTYLVGGEFAGSSAGTILIRSLETIVDNPDPAKPPPAVVASLELGLGVGENFSPLADGDDVQVQSFGQGGTHALITMRGRDFDGGGTGRLTIAVVDAETGDALSGPSTFNIFLNLNSDGVLEQDRLVPFTVDVEGIRGQDATFTFTLVEDSSAREATASRTLTLLPL